MASTNTNTNTSSNTETVTQLWTIEDLERDGPTEGRWELIDGELVEMSPSGRTASKLAALIAYLLLSVVRPRRLGEVYSADAGFVLFPDRRVVRVPDVAFVRAERLVDLDEDGFLRLAPDLAVEVRSPTDRTADVLAKIGMYLDAGVRLVWLVEPAARSVTVYAPGREPRRLGADDRLDGEAVVPGFAVDVAELFR